MTTLPVHPGADAVLAALDPEQREVAAHPAGPVCVLAGAGTGKTRAITHRIAYGVLAGVYQPQRVLAVTFTARAAGEMRTRLRDLGVGGVQARTFHAAALRQLHYFWPQAVGGARPRCMPHKASAVAEAGGRLRLRLDSAGDARPRRRDRVGEGLAAHPRVVRRRGPAQRREPPGRPRRHGHGPAVRRLRGGQGRARASSTSRTSCCSRSASCASTTRSPARSAASTATSSSTSTRTSPRCSSRCSSCGWGSATTCASSATRPDHLLLHRRLARAPARLPHPPPARPAPSAGAQLPLDAAGGGPGQPRAARPRRPAAPGSVELRAQRADGPAPELHVADNDPAEAADRRDAHRRAASRPGHPPSEIAVLFRTNAQSEAFEEALAERGIPYLVRGGERFFSRKEVRDAIVLMRGAARSDDGSVPLPDSPATCCSAPAGAAQAPDQRRARPASAGSRWPRWPRWPTTCRPRPRGPAARPRARARGARRGPARADGAGRHAGVAARGQGPGVGRRLPGRLLRRAAAHHAGRHPGGGRGGAPAALRRRDPGPRAAACCPGPGPARPAAAPRGGRPGSSTARRGARRGRPLAAQRAARAGAAAGRPRPRCGHLPHAAGPTSGPPRERTIGRCSTCPPTMDERLFEALREWRLATARAADVPAFVVFTDATLTAIAEQVPGDAARWRGSPASARPSSSATARTSSSFSRIFLIPNSAVLQRYSLVMATHRAKSRRIIRCPVPRWLP